MRLQNLPLAANCEYLQKFLFLYPFLHRGQKPWTDLTMAVPLTTNNAQSITVSENGSLNGLPRPPDNKYLTMFIFLYLLPFYLPRFSLHILLIVLFFCRNCEEYWSCEKITVRVNTSNTGLASSSQHPVERKLGNPSGHVTISKYWKFFFLVIYQTWEKVFNNISKHLEERWKTDAKQRTFENKEMFGTFDETLSHVFFFYMYMSTWCRKQN